MRSALPEKTVTGPRSARVGVVVIVIVVTAYLAAVGLPPQSAVGLVAAAAAVAVRTAKQLTPSTR